MKPTSQISIVSCDRYDPHILSVKLREAIFAVDDLSWIKPGMKIAIKTNLVTGSAPEKAVISHPVLVTELTSLLTDLGALVIIGDSPGGPFTENRLKSIYRQSSMDTVTQAGGSLNLNVNARDITFPQAKVMKQASMTSWLLDADAIISVCKLKTHGMMHLSANVKNMFGAIPGTMKAEYHYRFPNHADFADMLIDINEYLKPRLYITDAIVGMEGNGPTSGTARQIGALLASKNPYALDMVCADIIGLDPKTVPTIQAALERMPQLCCFIDKDLYGNPNVFHIPDYQNISSQNSIIFAERYPAFLYPIVNAILTERPRLNPSECIGCQRCKEVCPAKAIHMRKNRPVIDTSVCIRCFCCQEFCPKGALKVKRSLIAQVLQR